MDWAIQADLLSSTMGLRGERKMVISGGAGAGCWARRGEERRSRRPRKMAILIEALPGDFMIIHRRDEHRTLNIEHRTSKEKPLAPASPLSTGARGKWRV